MAGRTDRTYAYWATQVVGWSIYCSVVVMWNFVNGMVHGELLKAVASIFLIGVSVSHGFRYLMLRLDWLRLGLGKALPRAVLGSLLMGAVAFLFQILINDLFFPQIVPLMESNALEVSSMILNWSILFLLWSLAYFAYHYFIQHRLEEIENLRLTTAMRESELSNLRSQLNPHFMFNALNSIRALVDEDPEAAKTSILQLSNILRSSLTLGKRRSITLEEELEVVKAYLSLEKVRYEERIRVSIDVADGLEKASVPPMMLQTLVENAVKHGISSLTDGGLLSIVVNKQNDELHVLVKNSGEYRPGGSNGTGIGLKNTQKRLELMFGKDTEFSISNQNGLVVTHVIIPHRTQHESVTDR